MKPLGRLLVLLSGLALTVGPALAQDTLKRLTLRQDVLGWEGVGRVDLGGGFCSGVLVSADLVLTAGHCLVDQRTGDWREPEQIVFKAGFRDGEIIAERRARQAVVMSGYDPDDADAMRRLARDVALIQLDAPIPTASARPFLTTLPHPDREVSVVSYGEGRMDALSRQASCSLIGRRDGVMAFDCDGTPGSSGAPVFDTAGNRIRIVSIIVAGSRDNGEIVSIGPELHQAVPQLRQDLRAGRGIWSVAAEGARRVGSSGQNRGGTGARFLRP